MTKNICTQLIQCLILTGAGMSIAWCFMPYALYVASGDLRFVLI